MARRALKTIFARFTLALSIAFVLGWFVDVVNINPEIASRLHVDYADFALALASGAAGALSLTSGAPGSLHGVMVGNGRFPRPVLAHLCC